MSKELELAVADSLGALTKGSRVKPAHTHANCLNCGALLQGPYCHACGQNADDHHRSILHLMWEAIEGFTHLDGRLAKTLPALLLRPGALARDHIEGRRTRHVPPFRLFLICLLIFMVSMEAIVHRGLSETHGAPAKAGAAKAMAGAQAAKVGAAKTAAAQAGDKAQVSIKAADDDDDDVTVNGVKVSAATAAKITHKPVRSPLQVWLRSHIQRAAANREFYVMLVFEWAHRLAVAMLPILAGLLTLLYVYKRKFYVYDHLVVSMQYLSFCFLLWAVVGALPQPLAGWAFIPATIWTPINLFMTLRGAYGSSLIGAALKALFLWLSSLLVFGLLLTGLLTLALNQM